MSVPTHTGSATRSTMPAQCATINAARPPRLSVVLMPGSSDRRRARHEALAHDVGELLLVAAGDLDLAQAGRVLHHHAATLPAALLEGGERLVDGRLLSKLLGQHDRVFDADARTGRKVGRGRMHRVADQ